jgi:HD-like signal output (HDOD) protein
MTKTKGLAAWTDRINGMEMPAFDAVVREVKNLTANELSSANQVASEILKDTSIASQVLRSSNSVQYNPMNIPIGTISRAVIQIGYEEVKTIVLSVIVMERLFKGRVKRERLLECIARSFHAATQARNLLVNGKKQEKEEVFVAGLLYNIAEMAMWGCEDECIDELNLRLDDGEEKAAAIRGSLGTSFKAVNKEVARLWGLGPVLMDAYSPPKKSSDMVQAVALGEVISRSASHGWRSENMSRVYSKVSAFLDVDAEQAKEFIKESADEAGIVAATFGVPEVCRLIPWSHQETLEIAKEKEEEAKARKKKREEREIKAQENEEKDHRIIEGKEKLNMDAFEELPKLVLGKSDINRVFQFLVKAFQQGLMCQRSAIHLFDARRTRFESRYVFGEGTETWREDILVNYNPGDMANDLFSICVNKRNNYWLGEFQSNEEHRDFKLKKLLGDGDCFVAPVSVSKRIIGVFYADNGVDGKLSAAHYNAFNMFVQQASMALAYVGRKK